MSAKGTAANITITGATGSGKTTHAKQFIDIAPAAVILDFYSDYEANGGIVTESFAEAIDYLLANAEAQKFRLVYRDPDVKQSLNLLQFANEVQKQRNAKTGASLVLVQEEAWRFSTPQNIPPLLHQLYTGARRWGIANIAISQRDVNMNPTIRAASQVTIAFQNMKISEDTKLIFGKRAETIPSLEPITWPKMPVENTNFLQVPEGKDTLKWWRQVVL